MSFEHAGIVGAGAWGTALALLLHRNGGRVTMWGHEGPYVAQMRAHHENTIYLPGVPLPESLGLTDDLGDLHACDLLLLVTPSKAVREVAARLGTIRVRDDAVLLSCTKGVERGTGRRMTEIFAEHLPGHTIAALSGPSHAEEVARQMPTCVTIACRDPAAAQRLQLEFSNAYFRAYTSEDVAGVELGGALKNIYAVAAGMCDGLGLGDNAKAALVTRALVELSRIGVALGGRHETFTGLSGVGDLIVTCFSRHSRNRSVGERLGKGERLSEIAASMQMVAEGVPTTYSTHECAHRLGIDAPIIDVVRAILDGVMAPAEAIGRLLSREPKRETS